MKKNNSLSGLLTRRDFIKYAMSGTCLACMTGITGICLPVNAYAPQKGFVNPVPSPWFTRLSNSEIECSLCPKQCRLSSGKRGKCGVRENREGKGYTLAYGNPVLVQIDPVERKPFFHVMPGTRALSVSTAGCPLECKFCEVWDMALVAPEEVYTYDLSPEKIVNQAKSAGADSISYAFGEPVVFYEYMTDIAVMAKKEGLLNLMHTSGYISSEPLKEIAGNLDAANIDLKSFDPDFYRNMVGGKIEPVKETLRILKNANIHIEITSLIIPTLNDHMDQIKKMCTWIKTELGANVPVHFARFYPLYKLANLPPTPVSTLDRARNTAMECGLNHVYIARVTGHEAENTFCPECREKIVSRIGFVIEEVHLENGKCAYCSNPVAGIWA